MNCSEPGPNPELVMLAPMPTLFVFLSWYFFRDSVVLISSVQALDPTIKTTYAKEKWQQEFYEAGLQRLEAVVSRLVTHLLSLTCKSPGKLLLDPCSGVGNVVLQAALQSGWSAFGVELMEKPPRKWLVSNVCG